jgi:hypothetical protein
MTEWPQERRHRLNERPQPRTRLADLSPQLIEAVQSSGPFASCVEALLEAFENARNPEDEISGLADRLGQPDAFADYDDIVRHAALGLVAVAALIREPSRQMWEYLASLAYFSAPLEGFLSQSVIAAVARDARFRDAFLGLARDVIEVAAREPGRRAFAREKGVGAHQRERWRERAQLSAVWQGRFDHSFHAVGRDDDHILAIVADIDTAAFVQLLGMYDFPDPVVHALTWCGAFWRFERWREIAAVAPAAFDQNATWTGSFVLPTLLLFAQQQGRVGLGHGPTDEQVLAATAEVNHVAAEVAKTLAQRADYAGCVTRWGAWIARSMTIAASNPANTAPSPADARVPGFTDSALLDALIAPLPAGGWSSLVPSDPEPWEPWCRLVTEVLLATTGKAPFPPLETLVDAWRLGPDDWSASAGEQLKAQAQPFTLVSPRADSYGARVLALVFAQVEAPAEAWQGFWNSTPVLREVVEFGDADTQDEGGWEGRGDAARLSMFQFSLGLMLLDHLVWPQREVVQGQSAAVASLLAGLDAAVREMAAIDPLNGKYWTEAVRHLAIRRATWFSGEGDGIRLDADARPSLADFIAQLEGDTENLIILAHIAQRNGVRLETLAEAFRTARVDLALEINLAERLAATSPRAISLTGAQLQSARDIVDCADGQGTASAT